MTLDELKARLAEIQVHAKKAFGQNFLINEMVVGKIVAAVQAAKPAFLVEVGPGVGAITEPLASFKPLLIELDRDLVEFWRKREFQVVDNDALKVNWNDLKLPDKTWLVSNLPYNISTTLFVDRCFGPPQLAGMVLMFQKEVAQRLTASPRTSEYGMLSVLAQTYWKAAKVADAAPRDFFPAPKIASRVLRFQRVEGDVPDPRFLSFMKAAFSHRRKFLLKNLGQLGDKLDWGAALEEMAISAKARAEELTPQQFADLYRRWKAK
jgi:16S rRNA (adenine1518-N6/adenine1519-N6)-dimethyltransferase